MGEGGENTSSFFPSMTFSFGFFHFLICKHVFERCNFVMTKISKNSPACKKKKKNPQEKVIAQFNPHNLCDCTSDKGRPVGAAGFATEMKKWCNQ